MRRRRAKTGEAGLSVPAYIVTFSDMVTLLLTFFVMLLSLAQMQDPAMVDVGRDAFVRSIRYFGLGMLTGTPDKPDFGHIKKRHRLKASEDPEVRTIDATQEDTWRLFKRLSRSYVALPSQIVAERTDFSVISVRFGAGEWTLNDQSRTYIENFCAEMVNNCGSENLRLYVLGIACEIEEEHERLVVSAKRAESVAELMRSRFKGRVQWPVHWWGAGDGGEWVSSGSAVAKESQILVAVLRVPD